MAASPKNKKQPNKITSLLSSKRNISILLIVIIAAFGAWRVFLSEASPNNCQLEKSVNICDIDQVQGNLDNILSNGAEAYNLNKKDPKNWPQYYGTAFRAPTSALDGSQPVYRVYNSSVTAHDYMLEAGKKDKEAKNPGKVTVEKIAFYAWPDGKRTGTVAVYRLTQSGGTTKVIFTTDRAWRDKLIAADVNNKDGWKDGGIPFYAFPPAYQAIGTNGKPQANPYDCSIKENFVSDRCTAARNNVATAVKEGNIAASNSCPTTLTAYINEPFPSRFPKACQDKWNKESSNCSIKENFASDRCKDARVAFEKAEKERIARENAERQAAEARQNRNTGSGRNTGGGTGGSSSPRIDPKQPTECPRGKVYFGGSCKNSQDVRNLALIVECRNSGRFWVNGACIRGVSEGKNWWCKLNPGEYQIQGPKAKWNKGDAFLRVIYNVKNRDAAQKRCDAMRTFINRTAEYRGYTNQLSGPY